VDYKGVSYPDVAILVPPMMQVSHCIVFVIGLKAIYIHTLQNHFIFIFLLGFFFGGEVVAMILY